MAAPRRTLKQERAWLFMKLGKYLHHITQPNAYGHTKKAETIILDLRDILDDFEERIRKARS